jgi:hypothetical protein
VGQEEVSFSSMKEFSKKIAAGTHEPQAIYVFSEWSIPLYLFYKELLCVHNKRELFIEQTERKSVLALVKLMCSENKRILYAKNDSLTL